MEFMEADPLPKACLHCADQDCDECAHMGERWPLSPEDAQRLEHRARERAVLRFQRELDRLEE